MSKEMRHLLARWTTLEPQRAVPTVCHPSVINRHLTHAVHERRWTHVMTLAEPVNLGRITVNVVTPQGAYAATARNGQQALMLAYLAALEHGAPMGVAED